MADTPATPERQLRELRRKQEADRKRRHAALSRARQLERRLSDRAKRIKDWADRARLVARLNRHGVREAWLVLTEADRAAHSAQLPVRRFRALVISILWRETGLPQRTIYGCDHGPRTGPPYCNQAVTRGNAAPFIRWVLADPWNRMNGMHWTQTTWYEKLQRVLNLGEPWKPQPHLRVCLGDLAVLVREHGWWGGSRAYNGSGPAADAYANDVVNNKLPAVLGWL